MTATMERPKLSETRIAARYIPPNSTKIEHRLGVCYVGETLNGPRQIPTFIAIAYAGTAGKRSFYESYRTAEARNKRVSEFFAGLESTEAMRAGFKAERIKPHTVKIGEIIHHSWGWEQTQCDFYQVLSVTTHGATIQAIGSESVEGSAGFMSERRVAVPNGFHGEPFKVSIDGHNTVTGGGPEHRELKHGCANVWTGKPEYCSWYA